VCGVRDRRGELLGLSLGLALVPALLGPVLDDPPVSLQVVNLGGSDFVFGFSPTACNPMPSATVRQVSQDTAGPARKTKRPWETAPAAFGRA